MGSDCIGSVPDQCLSLYFTVCNNKGMLKVLKMTKTLLCEAMAVTLHILRMTTFFLHITIKSTQRQWYVGLKKVQVIFFFFFWNTLYMNNYEMVA